MRITANHQHLSLLLLLATAHSKSNTTNFSYSFSSFDSNDNSSVLVLRDSNINLAADQLTPDTINYLEYFANKFGRVFIKKPFKLWGHLAGSNVSSTATTKHVASFNTSFSINIVRANGSVPGEGFAFLIAPSPDSPPPRSIGRFLDLTNAYTNGNSSNYLIAIELDTVKQSYDPEKRYLFVGLILGAAVAAAVILGLFYIRTRRDGDTPRGLMDAINSLPGMPREFKFNTLKKATNNFDKKLKLGKVALGRCTRVCSRGRT